MPPIRDVLAQVDGTYDIYYYNMLTKIGQRFVKGETDGYSWCWQFKIIRRSFIGNAKFTIRKDMAGDYDFNKTLIDQHPTCNYTGIFAYWYNYPRKRIKILSQQSNTIYILDYSESLERIQLV